MSKQNQGDRLDTASLEKQLGAMGHAELTKVLTLACSEAINRVRLDAEDGGATHVRAARRAERFARTASYLLSTWRSEDG